MYYIELHPDTNTTINNIAFREINNNPLWSSLQFENMEVMDINADGKDDFLSVSRESDNASARVIVLGTDYHFTPTAYSTALPNYMASNDLETRDIVYGDFNGDGKRDFMIPHGYNSNLWGIYYANPDSPNYFIYEAHFITPYIPKKTINVRCDSWLGIDGGLYEHNSYYGMDTNGDGKTDLVRVIVHEKWEDCFDLDSAWQISTFANNIGRTDNVSSFSLEYSTNFDGPYTPPSYDNGAFHNHDHGDYLPSAIPGSYQNGNSIAQLLMLKKANNSYQLITFGKDVARDNRLVKVKSSNNTIEDEIIYQELKSSDNNLGQLNDFYSSTNSLAFPHIELTKLPNTFLVKELKNKIGSKIKIQKFKYHGFTVHANGQGALGFIKSARSSWINENDRKVTWAVSVEDAQYQRMANLYSYNIQLDASQDFYFSSTKPLLNTFGLISLDENTYWSSYNLQTDKQYTILTTETKKYDLINNTLNQVNYEYFPTYNLTKKTIEQKFLISNQNILQSKSTKEILYDNNPTGIGNNYYVGRPNRVHSKSERYNDIKEHEELFTYTNNRLTKTRKRPIVIGQNLPYITEDFEYFTNGLLKKKTLSAPGSMPVVSARAIDYTYDPTNRFIKNTTDHFGHTILIILFMALLPNQPIILDRVHIICLTTGVSQRE